LARQHARRSWLATILRDPVMVRSSMVAGGLMVLLGLALGVVAMTAVVP